MELYYPMIIILVVATFVVILDLWTRNKQKMAKQ
jgi:hypothetical protein